MNYHDIRTDDMLNGSGLRVVLFVSGCNHYCDECHNPETWDYNSGEKFDLNQVDFVFKELEKEYISGITFSGGDPLYKENYDEVLAFCELIKRKFPTKSIWIYTGFNFEDVKDFVVMELIDVLVDGKYKKELADINYPWAGSTNQRAIDVQKSLKNGEVILWKD